MKIQKMAVRSRLQSLTPKDIDSIIAAVQKELNMQFYRGFDYSALQKGSDPITAMRAIGQEPQDEDAAIKAVAQQRGLDIAVVNAVWQARRNNKPNHFAATISRNSVEFMQTVPLRLPKTIEAGAAIANRSHSSLRAGVTNLLAQIVVPVPLRPLLGRHPAWGV
jgi:hypothetical protein